MKNPSYKKLISAFSLAEVLGAVAVLATIATVSVVSIKDTVQAGQKARAQKEIQNLNAALESFKSAGGVIRENATADEAILDLQRGIDLAGSDYAPLVSVPESEVQIAGESYSLQYDPEDGFSYASESGEGIGQGGSPLAVAEGGFGDSYAPGITPVTSENLVNALGALGGALPGSPEQNAILADLAVVLASGGLDGEQAESIYTAGANADRVYDSNSISWVPLSPGGWAASAAPSSASAEWLALSAEQQSNLINTNPALALASGAPSSALQGVTGFAIAGISPLIDGHYSTPSQYHVEMASWIDNGYHVEMASWMDNGVQKTGTATSWRSNLQGGSSSSTGTSSSHGVRIITDSGGNVVSITVYDGSVDYTHVTFDANGTVSQVNQNIVRESMVGTGMRPSNHALNSSWTAWIAPHTLTPESGGLTTEGKLISSVPANP